MKRARGFLWLVFALISVISLLLFTHRIGVVDRDDQATSSIQSATSNSLLPAQELAATVTTESPQRDTLDALDPAAQDSPHAIVPDAPQLTPSSPPAEATAPKADLPTSQASAPSADPAVKNASPAITSPPLGPAVPGDDSSSTMPKDELVTITSATIIRNGPLSSADIIGRAHAGAQARVAGTEPGWAQIVDPASGNKGWVDSSVLARPGTTDTVATEETPDMATPDTLSEDQRAAMSENEASATKHSAKAKKHHQRRRFAFRFVLRGFLR
jgi:hypothetical protein